jgi:ABC-type branched-subunit amino acid transport system ATPase component
MALVAEGVTVRFGGVTALSDVSVELAEGRVQGIIGPNGSGKSTLFNCLTGFVRPASGRVAVDGTDVTRAPVHRRIQQGVARTFQTSRFDPTATVWEAVACGFYHQTSRALLASMAWSPGVRRMERTVAEGVDALLSRFHLDGAAGAMVGELPLGKVRLVEVARAMATKPTYLLLDEPAAGLTEDEQLLLAAEITRLSDEGVGVLLVEHNFDLVIGLCESVLVLNAGTRLVEGPAQDVAADDRVRRVYLGEDIDENDEVTDV